MNTKFFVSIFLSLSLLSACMPPPSEPNTISKAFITVKERVILSDFPDFSMCTSQEFVPAGTQITIDGVYGDFVEVEYTQEGIQKKGFVPKVYLSELPTELVELSIEQVPWKPIVDYRNWSYFSSENGGQLIASPISENHTDAVTDISDHPVVIPLRIHFGLQLGSNQWGSVKIYGIPDNHIPWWKETTRMDVFTNAENYEVCIRDGTKENCSAEFTLNISKNEEITLLFLDKNGKHLQILDNDDVVIKEIDFTNYPGLNLPDGLFPEGVFHFGTSVSYPGTLKVTNLSITTQPTGIYESNWMNNPGLAELAAKKGVLIGTAFDTDMMMDDRYCSIVRHDFNLGAISAFSFADMWLGPGEYDFRYLDQQVNDSVKFGLKLYASHLVWGSYDDDVLPNWLINGDYSKEELLNILHDHITILVNRYSDRVQIWSIANEAPERDKYPKNDFWYDNIGSEYIAKSFQWAREADSDAILVLNAANNESPRDSETIYNIDTLYNMVKTMKEDGIPIDAVGMQTHLFLPWTSHEMPSQKDVQATMEKFGNLGVKVMITEMDVDMHEIDGTAQEKEEIQKKLYREMMTACIQSEVCTLFTTWGVSDLNSWITVGNASWVYDSSNPDAAPLLFDAEYNPKPAYFEVLKVLEEKK